MGRGEVGRGEMGINRDIVRGLSVWHQVEAPGIGAS